MGSRRNLICEVCGLQYVRTQIASIYVIRDDKIVLKVICKKCVEKGKPIDASIGGTTPKVKSGLERNDGGEGKRIK